MDDDLLTLPEAADVARISLRTLHQVIADGDGPVTTKIGSRRRFVRRDHLRDWLDAQAEVRVA